MKKLFSIPSGWLMGVGLLLCLPLLWGYFQPQFFHLHDFTHVARLAELERGVLEGQLPVRWSQNLGYGYGMPQFSFYGPLFYYEALFFRLFHMSYIWAIKAAVIVQVIASFILFFKLGEALWGKWGGLITAVAGIYAPYRLVDMYVRGAFAELAGMTMVLATLYTIYLWSQQPSWKRVVGVAITGAGILLSHTLMALISVGFVLGWLLYWVIKEKRWSYWRQLVAIGGLTIGLAAWFVIPAFFEKNLTQADQLTTGFSNYNFHFLYIRQFWQSHWGYGGSIWGVDDDISFELGKVQIIVSMVALGCLGYGFIKRKKQPLSLIVLIVGLLGASLFLSIMKSKFIWDHLPLLAYVQFPWRFLSIAALFLPMLCGAIFLFVPKPFHLLLGVCLTAGLVGSQVGYAHPEAYLENNEALYYSDPASIQVNMSGIIPDFLPKTASPAGLPTPVQSTQRFTTSPAVSFAVDINHAYEFGLMLPAHPAITFTASIFDFPGWKLYDDGREISHFQTNEGLITATLSATTTQTYLSGKFSETPLRLFADWISIIALIITVSFLNVFQPLLWEHHES